MRVISRSKLVKFWETKAGRGSEGALKAWYAIVNSRATNWTSFANIRPTYPSADLVGNCVVFNIGGNNFRLIARVLGYKVFVLKVMTHKEYDKNKWKEECGCYSDPPPRRPKKKSSSDIGRFARVKKKGDS